MTDDYVKDDAESWRFQSLPAPLTAREKAYRNLLVQVADEIERTGRTNFSRGMIENLDTLVDQEHEFSEELVSHAEELLSMIVGPERLDYAVLAVGMQKIFAERRAEIDKLKAERQRFENVALDQQTVIRHLNDKVERLEKEILVLCRRAR